jgi:hypothetical protein
MGKGMMSQRVVSERRSPGRADGHGEGLAPRPGREHPQEREARLRIAEAEARWRRLREMVLVGCAVFVVIGVCLTGTVLIYAPSAAGDKQAGMFMLNQIFGILFGAALSKAAGLKR